MSKCLMCWPRGTTCEWCEEREATHVRVVGITCDEWGQKREQVSPMCHGCAVEQKTEKDWGHAS